MQNRFNNRKFKVAGAATGVLFGLASSSFGLTIIPNYTSVNTYGGTAGDTTVASDPNAAAIEATRMIQNTVTTAYRNVHTGRYRYYSRTPIANGSSILSGSLYRAFGVSIIRVRADWRHLPPDLCRD